jgi:hypothetical protein
MKKYSIIFVTILALIVLGIYFYNHYKKTMVFCRLTIPTSCYRYTCNSGFISKISDGVMCSDGSTPLQGEKIDTSVVSR